MRELHPNQTLACVLFQNYSGSASRGRVARVYSKSAPPPWQLKNCHKLQKRGKNLEKEGGSLETEKKLCRKCIKKMVLSLCPPAKWGWWPTLLQNNQCHLFENNVCNLKQIVKGTQKWSRLSTFKLWLKQSNIVLIDNSRTTIPEFLRQFSTGYIVFLCNFEIEHKPY